MITLNQVSKSYRDAANDVQALDRINLILPETGLVFVVGRSGSGKSTLLHILGGTEKISEGEFLFRGKDLAKASQKELDHYRKTAVSFCFQSTNIFPDLTVEENIRFNERRFSSKRIHDICMTLSLSDLEHRKASQLSGGQQQRVAIARALYRDTPVLLCDEPTGALDSTTAKDVFSCLQQVSRTRLVVVVTHDEASALHFGDRLIRISDGHITEDHTLNGASAESEPSQKANKDETQKTSWLDVKLMMRSIFRHPVRSIAAVLLLECSLGVLSPALSFSTRDKNTMLASSIVSSSDSYVAYTKDLKPQNHQYIRKMYLEDLSSLPVHESDTFPVYKQSTGLYTQDSATCSLGSYIPISSVISKTLDQQFLSDVSGLAAWNDSFSSTFGWKVVAGRAPTAIDECMITLGEWETLQQYGFRGAEGDEWSKDKLIDAATFISNKPSISIRWNDKSQETTITGILDTHFIRSNYESLTSESRMQESLRNYLMYCDLTFGPHKLIYVSPAYQQSILSSEKGYVSFTTDPGINSDQLAFHGTNDWISVPYLSSVDADSATAVLLPSSEGDNGVVMSLNGFSSFWGNADLTLPSSISAKKYTDCLTIYCNFDELKSDSRYLSPAYLFASSTNNYISHLSLLAAGDYVSKNGIPSGDYLQNFISFATNIYKELSDDSSTSIPDFSSLDETKTGYLKSLYTAYLASYQLEMTNGKYLSYQNGGYYENEFGGPSGISLTRDLVTGLFAQNTPITKNVSFRAKAVGGAEETFSSELHGLSLNLTGIQEGIYFDKVTFDRLKLHYGNQGSINFFLAKKPNRATIKSALDGIDQSSGYYTIQNTLVWGYQYFAEYNEEQFLLISYITMAVLLLFSLTLLSLLGSFFTNERSYEMIMRRALGSSQRSVFLYLFLEILFLGVVSYLLSLLVSGLLVYFLNGAIASASGLPLVIFAINGFGALVSLAVVLLVSLMVSFFPASRESKKNIASRLKQLGN